jgi:hypothetical protein
MPFSIRNRPKPPQPEPLIAVVRDKVISALAVAAVAGMLALANIAWNVDFLVRELPRRLEDLNDRITATEREVKQLEEAGGRALNLLERYDDRLRKLEQAR